MKTLIKIKQMTSPRSENMIFRNLSRIMDIRILDIDTEAGKILVSYADPRCLGMVYRELTRIGCQPKLSSDFLKAEFGLLRSLRGRPMYT